MYTVGYLKYDFLIDDICQNLYYSPLQLFLTVVNFCVICAEHSQTTLILCANSFHS